jgi:hypothetical protein
MRKANLVLVPLAAAALLVGCRRSPAEFPAFTQEFVETTLALSPTGATAVGFHKYKGAELDTHLDDYSAAGVEKGRATWKDLKSKLGKFNRDSLDAESKADAELIDSQIQLAQLEDQEIQSWKHNPTIYVETIGNGLFVPYSLEYAPVEERWRHIVARLGEVPRLLNEAKLQLVDSPTLWKNVAIEENEGTIGMIEQTFPAQVPAEGFLRPGREERHCRHAGLQRMAEDVAQGHRSRKLAAGQREIRQEIRARDGHGYEAGRGARQGGTGSDPDAQRDVRTGPAAAPRDVSEAHRPGGRESDHRGDVSED